MTNLKHVGRMAKNKRRVVVAYRVVPNEPDNCIVVTTENLSADEHDTLMRMVESPAGQGANDLALVMARTPLPDGRIMLPHFHATGKLIKVPTADVEMVPNRNTSILLSDLNELIAQQQGVTVADLAVSDGSRPSTASVQQQAEPEVVSEMPVINEPLTDDALAAKYRSDADKLYKEAKRLRDEAERLSPTKKKTANKETVIE